MASEAEVDDLHVAPAADKDVRRLQVAMDDVAALAVILSSNPHLHVEQAAQNLVEQGFHVLLSPAGDLIGVPHDLRHIPSSVFLAIEIVK